MDDREKGRIAQRWRFALLFGLQAGENVERRLAADIQRFRGDERLQRIPQSGFPVDQRAIAIEGQRLEIAQLHLGSSS